MAPMSEMSSTSLEYLHPALRFRSLSHRGHGYVATKTIKKGELLLEEKPFVWDSGTDSTRPDLSPGVEWLLRTGAVHDLHCPQAVYLTLRERAEAVAATCTFRHAAPCVDGGFLAMLFRASSGFNHSCFPNAGAY